VSLDPKKPDFPLLYHSAQDDSGQQNITRKMSAADINDPEESRWKKFNSRRSVKIIRRTILVIVWLSVIVTGYIWYQADSIVDKFSEGAKKEIVDSTKKELNVKPKKAFQGKLTEAQTYLLVGSDIRPSEGGYGRSDSIMVVRVYPKQKMVSILSLPRDLYVEIPGYGTDRINAAYAYGGVPLLAKTIREWLGIPVNHFFQVDFSSFAGLVDELDGVYIPVDQRYYHYNDGAAENNWSSIDIEPGYQKLNGEDALAFVRFRHLDSDFYRASRQQLFLREVGRQLREQTSDPFKLKNLVEVVADGTISDFNNISDTLKLANTLQQIPSENIVRVVMPGEGTTINGASVLLTSDYDKKATIEEWGNPQKLTKDQGRKPSLKQTADDSKKIVDLAWQISNQLFNRGYLIDYKQAIKEKENTIKKTMFEIEGKRFRKPKDVEQVEQVLGPEVSPPSQLNSIVLPKHCIPQRLPEGFYWSDDSVHKYRLDNKPTLAAYATKGSGISILWMWTTLQNPAILEAPNDAVLIDNKKYNLYWERDTLRMIAWNDNGTITWITNTLQNELDKSEMIALAKSCF
jgi:LCP family protein required for cell wall assembly